MPIDIFITSWNRRNMTEKTINYIQERTTKNSYRLHIFDNGSDAETQIFLYGLLQSGILTSVHFEKRNTGCLYNKLVFHSMVESKEPYYICTDNDVYPPKLSPDWLSRMISIMDAHPELALLAPQLPPQSLQMPYKTTSDVVYCKAVGNTFKIVRREAMASIIPNVNQQVGIYGDDGMVSEMLERNHWKIAFCKDIYCWHAGQCLNWGYKPEEVNQDPRKSGYGQPFSYNLANEDTFEPEAKWKI